MGKKISWLQETTKQGINKPVTRFKLDLSKLPKELVTKQPDELTRLVYAQASTHLVYCLILKEDPNTAELLPDSMLCEIESDGSVTKHEIEYDEKNALTAIFKIANAYSSGEHYRISTEHRDIVMEILPIGTSDEDIDEAITRLRAQLAISAL
jgi:hypothetical protein